MAKRKTETFKCPKCRGEFEVLASSLRDEGPTPVQCSHVKKDGTMCGHQFEVESE